MKYGGICGEEEGHTDYGELVQPSHQHVASCVKGIERGLDTRALIDLAQNGNLFGAKSIRKV